MLVATCHKIHVVGYDRQDTLPALQESLLITSVAQVFLDSAKVTRQSPQSAGLGDQQEVLKVQNHQPVQPPLPLLSCRFGHCTES